MTVTVVDYGAGNIRSVLNALAYTGADAVASAIPESVASAERIVLPGVGAAGSALDVLRDRGLSEALESSARRAARPFSEFVWACSCWPTNSMSSAFIRGLGWIGGRVGPISEHVGTDVRIPHIGWARIDPVDGEAASFFGRNEKSNHFYFCHTNCLQTSAPAVAATVDLTTPVVAAVLKENVFAVQFHPEKSQLNGIRLIEAFLDWHALSARDADKSNHPQPVVARRAARER